MVIVKLAGGLGNQMFQYAAGMRLAHVDGSELKLDLSGFENDKLHRYALGAFITHQLFADEEEIEGLTLQKHGLVEYWINMSSKRVPGPPMSHIREKHFHFDPAILELPDNVYLDGYWQSEKYFADIADIIRKEFTVKKDQEGKNRETAKLIASCDSVSLHIRRGGYVSNPETRKVHGTCDLDYYSRCVAQLTKTVKNPHFLIFSDVHA